MSDKLDMSLDDIIKQNNHSFGRGRGRGGRGGRGGRRGRGGRGAGVGNSAQGPVRNRNSGGFNRSAPYAKVYTIFL